MARGKGVLWGWWGLESIIALVYAILALCVFGAVSHVKNYAASYEGYFLNAILSAALLSAILVLGFLVLSLVFLIKKQAYHQGFAGFTAGINLASSFMLSLFVLLACIVFTSGKTELRRWEQYDRSWNSGSTILYYACFSLGYILAGLYMGHAVLFYFYRHAFEDVIHDVETTHLAAASPEKPSAAHTPTPAQAPTGKPSHAGPAASSVGTAAPAAEAAPGGYSAPAAGAAAKPPPAFESGSGLHGGPSTASPFHKEEAPMTAV